MNVAVFFQFSIYKAISNNTEVFFLFFFSVTLSKNMNSLMLLTVHRSAADNHVCADEWQENLSQLACNQMGLG